MTRLLALPSSLLVLLLALSTATALGQTAPADFAIVGSAGGLAPGTEYAVVQIAADGSGSYQLFAPDEPGVPALASSTFTLSQAERDQLWQLVQANSFFTLQPEHSNDDLADRTYAELRITANGTTHVVTTQNIAVPGFDNITTAINALTPGTDDLVYDITEPFTFTPLDICDQPGKRGATILQKRDGKVATTGTGLRVDGSSVSFQNTTAHAGTVVGYRMSLEDAVKRGIASLSGKGEFFGDGAAIAIDNSGNQTSDNLELKLYLEFWGPNATAANAAAAEAAIENEWNGKMTSDGKTLNVDVITRVSPGGTAAPGTEGYHQIKLIESGISGVSGRGTSFNVNEGVGSGTWRTTGNLLDEMYAHEAGHLFGFEDRYVDYRKQDDGTWKRKSDDMTFTVDELAAEITPQYPGFTEQQIKDWLNDGKTRITPPEPGHEDDIMANKKKDPVQSDIDALAAKAGIIVEVRPGDILSNKDGTEQNFAITRSEDVFVPPGGSKMLEGLYVACIDHHKGIPSLGVQFDLAPSLSSWSGVQAAPLLQQLVDYADDNDLFCNVDAFTQLSIWRLTDNSAVGDPFIDQYLADAGINVGNELLDFPRMSNPNAGNPGTTVLTPHELYVVDLSTSSPEIVGFAQGVSLNADLFAPSLDGVSSEFNWTLLPPAQSGAALTATQGQSTSFTTDVRGIYSVQMRVDVTDAGANAFAREATRSFSAPDAWTDTFESGTLRSGQPFFWKATGAGAWQITEVVHHTGSFGATSPQLNDDEFSGLEASFDNASSGTLTFAYRVSSELDFDFLHFALDGNVLQSWSGEVDWSLFSINIPAGSHTVQWIYEKDESVAEGADRAWVDDVYFPVNATFTAVEGPDGSILPETYALFQNYPNPFNPSTVIVYDVPELQHVTLTVYDLLGRQVTRLVDAMHNAGRHEVMFSPGLLANGVYQYELRAGSFVERKSMVLVR